MRSFTRFLFYNNAVPLGIFVVFGMAGAAAAASPQVREAVYSETEEVRSVDNTFIAYLDLDNYTPRIVITNVTSDEEFYYVSYSLTTVALVDYVWQETVAEKSIKVSKKELGKNTDLGLFVTRQLKQIIDQELAYLKDVQEFEKRSISQKSVATVYSGLVGKFLDESTETLPGYKPVVKPPKEEEEADVLALPPPPDERPQPPIAQVPDEQDEPEIPVEPEPEEGGDIEPPASTTPPTGDVTAPVLQLLGGDPARVEVGGVYSDLGAVATDNSNEDLSIEYFVNGASVAEVIIDTSVVGIWQVRYEAADSAGNRGFVERTIEVYGNTVPEEPDVPPTGDDSASTTPPVEEPEPTPTETVTTPPVSEPPASSGSSTPPA